MTNYQLAEQVPWLYPAPDGKSTYFKGANKPIAVVLHIQQGWASTARQWALSGHYGASWHYTVCLDGSVMQHLQHTDGGYHAGIASPPAPTPTWPLWQGPNINVNNYTIGIEHEGMSGDGFTPEQAAASKALCQWLATELDIPFDREHFPPHADIDLVNRANDFAPPAMREAHYAYLFEGGNDMADPRVDALLRALYAGSEATADDGTLLSETDRLALAIYRMEQADAGQAQSVAEQAASAKANLASHIANPAAGVSGPVADHTHEAGKVKRS